MFKNRDNILGTLILISGAIIGAAGALLYKENQPKHAGKVLQEIKHHYRHLGPIQGSWIDYDAIEYHVFESQPLVYIGGLTIKESDGVKAYQFATDVYTGQVLDFFEIGCS